MEIIMANQPDLAALLNGYLQRQVDAHNLGLGTQTAGGEVVPYEAAPVQPIDARLAWAEAVTAATLLVPESQAASWKAPPSWAALVAGHEPAIALPLCVGSFPQLVRDLHPLLQATDLTQLRPNNSRPLAVPALAEWAAEAAEKRQFPQVLLAIGTLRLARQFDQAAQVLQACEADVPTKWRSAWANEKAALAWQQGQGEQARALWDAQVTSVPVLFNRGMAALFLGASAEARVPLAEAVAKLPEEGAWYHLGRLYLALAEAR
jgi:tetratricopeptide (TPR) repeat protein